MEQQASKQQGTARLRAELASRMSSMEELVKMIEGEWSRLKEREDVLAKERAAFDEMRAKVARVHVPDKIKLSVGGTVFATSLEHLRRDPLSMLAAMFSGKGFKMVPDADGTYFIDRDPLYFPYIMSYLRHGKIQLPEDKASQQEYLEEAEFYQLTEICSTLRQALGIKTIAPSLLSSSGTTLQEDPLWVAVRTWLSVVSREIIYKATRDGWSAIVYHTRCDKKSPTLTVFRTTAGHIFGAFSSVARRSSGCYLMDSAAFLFTVSNPNSIPPTRYPVADPAHAVWDGAADLAVFGTHDIYPQREQDSDDGYIRFPLAYADLTGQGRQTFAGNLSPLRLAEIEVYQLVLTA